MAWACSQLARQGCSSRSGARAQGHLAEILFMTFPAVHSVVEFVLSVPDLRQASHFYTSFGLDVREDENALALYTFGHSRCWARILQGTGAAKRLEWISFGIGEDDLEPFAQLLREKGILSVESRERDHPRSLWLLGPDQLPIQLRVGPKVSPSAPGPRHFAPPPGTKGRTPNRSRVQLRRVLL